MTLLSTLDWKAMRTFLICCVVPSFLAAQSPALTPAQLMEDLDWFRRDVFAVEQSYTPAARATAQRRLDALEGSLGRTTPIAFAMELSRVVALADNGHSNLFAGGRARLSNRIPLRLATFGDEFRVMRADRAHADLLGAKLVAIDGKPVSVARDSGRTLSGGVPVWRDRNLPLFLESPEQLQVLGIARDSRSADYSFQAENGRVVVKRIAGQAPDGSGVMPPDFLLYAQPDADPGVSQLTVSLPWSLRDPMTAFRWRVAPEVDGLVVQMRRVVDGPGQPILQFLDEMKAKIAGDHPRNIVVDMRMNGGGNLNNARDFMKALPALVPGRIFVITGPGTFSAAISSVGYLEQAAPERVTIVGEEVGDRLVFFAEGRPATAPNSRLAIGLATQRHDYQNGCRAFTDCHGPVVRFSIAVPTLAPDLAAPLTFADWKAGRDPAIDAIARALKR